MSDCIFCKVAAGQAPAEILAEGDEAIAFLDKYPQSPGHTLIIPRRHAADTFEIDEDDAAAVMRLAIEVARVLRDTLEPDGLRLVQNNGRAAGQGVFHLHLHLIPRWHGRDPGIEARPLSKVARRIRAGW
jgi:histidine triad (HIT) family protein